MASVAQSTHCAIRTFLENNTSTEVQTSSSAKRFTFNCGELAHSQHVLSMLLQ